LFSRNIAPPCASRDVLAGVEASDDATVNAESRSRAPRSLGVFCAGAVAALAIASLRACDSSAREPAPIALWLADRDAGEIVALDRDLFVARRIPCAAPLAIEACADGGVWIVRDKSDAVEPRRRIERWSADGTRLVSVGIEDCVDLSIGADDAALLVDSAALSHPERASSVSCDGEIHRWLDRKDLSCIAACGDAIVLGTRAGIVVRIARATGEIEAELEVGGDIADVAPGPSDGSVWVLDGAGAGHLMLVDADLRVVWRARIQLCAARLAPMAGEERVWLCDVREPRARRFGPGGALELDASALPLAGFESACAWNDGGVLLIAPGAVLRLDDRGRLQPGQGGFNYLVSAARARRSRAR
jgi:hypothetical protein